MHAHMQALVIIVVAALAPLPLVFAVFCAINAQRILKLTAASIEARTKELETLHERAVIGERQRLIGEARRLADDLEDVRSRADMKLMLLQMEQRELLS